MATGQALAEACLMEPQEVEVAAAGLSVGTQALEGGLEARGPGSGSSLGQFGHSVRGLPGDLIPRRP